MSDVDDFIERNRITPEQYQRLVGTDFALPNGWNHDPGCAIQAPISWRDDYVISHRGDETDGGQGHNVSYRPPGQHHHVGKYATAAAAFAAVEAKLKETTPHAPTSTSNR